MTEELLSATIPGEEWIDLDLKMTVIVHLNSDWSHFKVLDAIESPRSDIEYEERS